MFSTALLRLKPAAVEHLFYSPKSVRYMLSTIASPFNQLDSAAPFPKARPDALQQIVCLAFGTVMHLSFVKLRQRSSWQFEGTGSGMDA